MFKHKMKSLLGAGVIALALGITNAAPLKILVVNPVGAYAHATAINWLSNYIANVLGPKQGWIVVAPPMAATPGGPQNIAAIQAKMNADTLATYNAIIFNNNTSIGNVITAAYRPAFQNWAKAGGGIVAWHGFLDHADLWPFVTDSLLAGTVFTVHSTWNSTGGRNARLIWDTTKIAGETTPRSAKPEYDSLKSAAFRAGPVNLPDEWYSFRSNPRLAAGGRAPDVLWNIDETTYDVAGAMG